VLVDGNEWGSETKRCSAYGCVQCSVLAILVNGGAIAKEELLQSVRRSWPVIVIEGSGRLADDVAALKGNRRRLKISAR
jgi:hypothetical protein